MITHMKECLSLFILCGRSWVVVVIVLIWAVRDVIILLLIPRADRAHVLHATTKIDSKRTKNLKSHR